MKRLHWMLGMAVLGLSGAPAGLLAAPPVCGGVADYKGTWAFFTKGAFVRLPPEALPLQGPFSQAGTFTSDGQGNVTIESTPVFNGIVLPSSSVSTYTITPECELTYSLTLPEPLAVPSTFKAVLSSNFRQNTVMVTDPPGTVVVGLHAKQDLRFCGTDDFSGAYQIDLEGSVISPASRAGRFHRLGRLVADGSGAFRATSIANYNGNLTQENFEGTYSVSARCFVTLNYNLGGERVTISGALGGHGEVAMVVVATPGWGVSGFLRQQ